MSLSILINNYTDFNLWANTRIINWLKPLGSEFLYLETPSSYPSIDATLQHILRAETFWHLFITGQDFSHLTWAVRPSEADNIMNELIEKSQLMKDDFAQFSEADLSETLHLNMPWAKKQLSRFEYIQHVVNHSTFHRGQIITMARALGITQHIPNTDYNMFHTLGA